MISPLRAAVNAESHLSPHFTAASHVTSGGVTLAEHKGPNDRVMRAGIMISDESIGEQDDDVSETSWVQESAGPVGREVFSVSACTEAIEAGDADGEAGGDACLRP